jgi:hypothetical protein
LELGLEEGFEVGLDCLILAFEGALMLSVLLSEKSRCDSCSFGVDFPVLENMREMRLAMVGLAIFAGVGGTGRTSPFAADRFMPAKARVTWGSPSRES